MEALIKSIFEITIFSSVMVLIVLTIKSIWQSKISFNIIMIAWMLVLARLIIPITFESPIHLVIIRNDEITETAAQETALNTITYETNNAAYNTNDYINTSPNNVLETPQSNTTVVKGFTKSNWLSNILKAFKNVSVWFYLTVIWLAGFAAIMFASLYSVGKFKNKIRTCQFVNSDKVSNIIKRNKLKINIKKDVKIVRCEYVSMPVTFGWLKPRILVPYGFEDRLSYEKLNLILKHELYHIKRNDILKNYLWLVAKSIHWFNPLVWIGYKEYIDDVEFAVDNAITKNCDKDTIYEYSQSILDVIRMSNYECNVPLAMSFCKDKEKLRKRVENMIKPNKRIKAAGILSIMLCMVMVFACFTTACQPTPDDLVVQNKADNELSEAIEQTASPQEETAIQQEHIIDEITNDKGNIIVNVDADVFGTGTNNLPVAYVEKYNLTQEDIDYITNVLIGDKPLLDAQTQTKEQIEKSILHIKQSSTDLNSDLAQSNGIDTIEDLKVIADERIAIYEEQWKSAPYSPMILDKLDITDSGNISTGVLSKQEFINAQAIVDFNKEEYANISYSNSSTNQRFRFLNFGEFNSRRYLESDSVLFDQNTNDSTFLEAKEVAMGYFDQLNIEGMTLGNVYLCGDRTRIFGINEEGIEGEWPIGSTKQYYVFSFNRAINEQIIDNSFYEGTATDREPDDTVYDKPLPYEYFEIWMDGDELVQFIWENPLQTSEIENDNVKVQIDLDKAIALMSTQLFIEHADMYQNKATDIQVNIDRVQLTLARIKQVDTGKYMIIPVWDFYGNLKAKITDEDAKSIGITDYMYDKDGDYFILNEPEQSIITINALDGSILDRASGY